MNHNSAKRDLGRYGESLAIEFLVQKGYRILEKNFRTRYGEIDIIAKEGSILCFVEVKTRHSCFSQTGWEAVSYAKRKKLTQMARFYLTRKRWEPGIVRFDCILILIHPDGSRQIEFIKGAFESVGDES